ncbi:MAG: hypothetical protein JXQ75_21330 [Phycisphaerae bacterium]|nr:hypothetical protein [Phycisphaerae bacterium]
MKRRQLFEIHELPACPQVVRELVTGFLEAMTALFRPYSPRMRLLVRAMRSTNTRQFVDLCSGNGGPWLHLARQIEQETGQAVSVVLTDKYPSREARRRTELTGGLSYLGDSVDARRVPEHLRGVRTLFNGLHHFRPADAKAVLQDAVAGGQPIAVFDVLQRNGLTLVQALLLPISVLLFTPVVRPVKWWRWVLTYVIPLAPLVALWDGVVSVLRCYRPEELRAMADELVGAPYHWEAGSYRHRSAPVTYMIGYPVEETKAPAHQR